MTADCTRCGAATAAHMLTYIGPFRREDQRTALCPPCWARWLEMEQRAAVSLEQHPGPPRRVSV